jgi:hypothetical protein
MTETAQTKVTEQGLQNRIAAAQERLDALLEEVNRLGAREREAQQARDVDAVLAVRQRGDELSKELRHAKADVQDALADLEGFNANQLRDDPEQLARLELLLAEREKIDGEVKWEQTEIDFKRTRRDRHIGQQTEHRFEAGRLRQEGIEWG